MLLLAIEVDAQREGDGSKQAEKDGHGLAAALGVGRRIRREGVSRGRRIRRRQDEHLSDARCRDTLDARAQLGGEIERRGAREDV